ADTLKEIKEKGFVATILVPIKKPGAYQMRVIIRDDVTSKIGSASEFIQVPNIKKDQLYISGLLLQRSETEEDATNSAKQFKTDPHRIVAEDEFRLNPAIKPGNYIVQMIVKDGFSKEKSGITYQFTDFDVEP